MNRILIAVLMLFLAGGAASAAPATAPVSRLTYLLESRCQDIAPEEGEEVGDSLLKRCAPDNLPPIWMLYLDGTRLRLGFGTAPAVSGMFDADRDANWPIEWRGRGAGRVFTPYAVIIRLRAPGERPSRLVVFHLQANGASCIVGDVPPGPTQNADARVLADSDAPCEAEPDFLGD